MKIVLKIILFLLPTCGVFSAERNVSMSVIGGQSATLTVDLNTTDIKEINRLIWRFLKNGNKLIAKISGNGITYPPNGTEIFRGRLKLDNQTGSLTIMNIKTSDAGLYKAEINSNNLNLIFFFKVTVNGAVAGISVVVLLLVFAGTAAFVYYHHHKLPDIRHGEKIVSVKERESVTLKPDAVIQRDDRILWTFGPQETRIAEVSGHTREIFTGDGADGRFRDRLMLDSMTGSVTITNTASEHVGVYKLKIISSTGTSYQTFILTLTQDVMSVTEGSSVTLNPDTEIQKSDLILWMFGDEDSLIAQLQKTRKTRDTFDGPDARFKKKLKLDKKTGSLTITNIKINHTGLYKLQISNSSRATTSKNFKVLVNFIKVSVTEGDAVTLKVNDKIGKKDPIQWLYEEENTLIAEIKEGSREILTHDTTDGRFKDRLTLDGKTRSLTIKNTRPEHTGLYTLLINGSKGASDKRFIVIVKASMILGKQGKNTTLNVNAELQRDDLILWMFGDEDNLIAQVNGETTETTFTEADERFRDKLLLDKKTGSLTVRNITSQHSGAYKLHIVSSRRTFYRRFRVFVCGYSDPNTVSVMAGESLILITNFDVEQDEKLQWTFEDEDEDVILASGMNGDVSKTSYGDDKRFRGRLELHHQTASLTVKNTRSSDTGVYQLRICNGRGQNFCLNVNVTISDDSRNALTESVNIQMPQSRN
ncbi:uncharacterized protein LOC130216499 isoform X2 [Danio aesculapii]|uniref:uncharacterized protein LOC130216499 isoform X2 n=1 Tax=Danio aesculapii TaxID=1142201 RepID=UPI0024BF1DD4|nr:uncharacterized protein LOC130216499 isoform X2 [Danio aesculapii]